MLKKVGILANGGDVSGFNAVIRAIVKTAEKNWNVIEKLDYVSSAIINYSHQKYHKKKNLYHL